MVARFSFHIAGEQQINRAFQRIVDYVDDLSPAYDDIAKDFRELEQQQFATQGGSGSGGWTPLSERYARRKAVLAPGATILVLSGRMRKSLTSTGGDFVRRDEPHELTLGTQVRSPKGAPYPLFHQKGGGRLPMRKPIELSERDRRNWTRIIHRFAQATIDAAVKQGGGPSLAAGAAGVGPNP